MTEETNFDISNYILQTIIFLATFLLICSFVVSRNIIDLAYLILLHSFLIIGKVSECIKK